jgi:hypothetical protein
MSRTSCFNMLLEHVLYPIIRCLTYLVQHVASAHLGTTRSTSVVVTVFPYNKHFICYGRAELCHGCDRCSDSWSLVSSLLKHNVMSENALMHKIITLSFIFHYPSIKEVFL